MSKIENRLLDLIKNLESNLTLRSIKQLSYDIDDIAELATEIDEESLSDNELEYISTTFQKIIDTLFAQPLTRQEYTIVIDDIIPPIEGILDNLSAPPIETDIIREEVDYNIPLGEYGAPSMYTEDEYKQSIGNLPNSSRTTRELELEKDRNYLRTLVNDTRKRNYLVPEEAKSYINNIIAFNCENDVDYISQEDITEKMFLNPGWIFIQNETNNRGTCYQKESLLGFMTTQVIFGPWPQRQHKFFKLPYPNIYIDKRGLELIPTSKALKIVKTGVMRLGTYFGVSTTHDLEFSIYTLQGLRPLPPLITTK